MITSNPELIEHNPPAAEDGEVNLGISQTELSKRAKMEIGETLLENTLLLIEQILNRMVSKTLAGRLLAELRQDKNQLGEIKRKLLNNINEHQGDDRRDLVAEQIASKLIEQS